MSIKQWFCRHVYGEWKIDSIYFVVGAENVKQRICNKCNYKEYGYEIKS